MDNVFVLCTGRCGSVTFANACGHLSNFTAGHESNSRLVGPERLRYPSRHIEVDNRLAWYLGRLGATYDDARTLYVHLRRDPEEVAHSHLVRWESTFKASMIRAFAHGIVMEGHDWPLEQRMDVCRDYVATVNANIEEFLRGRDALTVDLETAKPDFARALDRIGAEGDLEAAVGEWDVRHNVTPPRLLEKFEEQHGEEAHAAAE
jgi:outer membrane murein-binding lipoprotein Lpp